jgi:Fic-DOC domain mobile mystery protein B
VTGSNALGLVGDADGQTPVDADEAQYLTPQYAYISARQELNEAEAMNIADALLWLEDQDLDAHDILHQAFLRDFHRRMFGDVWTWAGRLRQRETTIGIAPAQIQERLQALLGDTLFWIENETYDRSEIGVRLHHLLVLIHPFANGNGRHARLASSAIANALGLGFDHYSWGSRSNSTAAQARRQYLTALRAADHGDYSHLLRNAVS